MAVTERRVVDVTLELGVEIRVLDFRAICATGVDFSLDFGVRVPFCAADEEVLF
jgi:hypothetical protein